MGENKVAPDDLRTLAEQLRSRARELGDAQAIATADKLHAHLHSGSPSTSHIRALLAGLEATIALSPNVNAILQALSNIGI
jgi:hypothetical protein